MEEKHLNGKHTESDLKEKIEKFAHEKPLQFTASAFFAGTLIGYIGIVPVLTASLGMMPAELLALRDQGIRILKDAALGYIDSL